MERKIIIFFILGLVVLSLIPLLWSGLLKFEITTFTEEYYKTLVNLLLIFLGFYFFEYLIRTHNEKQERAKIEEISKKLSNVAEKLINSLEPDEINKNNTIINILAFTTLIKTLKLNPEYAARSQIIDLHLVFFTDEEESAIESLLKFCKGVSIGQNILKSSIHILRNYFNTISQNSTANILYK